MLTNEATFSRACRIIIFASALLFWVLVYWASAQYYETQPDPHQFEPSAYARTHPDDWQAQQQEIQDRLDHQQAQDEQAHDLWKREREWGTQGQRDPYRDDPRRGYRGRVDPWGYAY